MAFARETEYRTNFVINVVESMLGIGLGVLAYGIMFDYAGSVAGWSHAEALMLVGVAQMVICLINMIYGGANMFSIADYIREGELDYILLRPVSSRFVATLRYVNLFEVANVLLGLGVVVYAGNQAGIAWNVVQILAALTFGVCGLVLIYAAWCGVATLAFWFQGGLLDPIFFWILEARQYPVTFFRGWVRVFFTWIFPIAFATTFPVQALSGEIDLRLVPIGMVFAALALAGSKRFWTYGVRRYSSASS